MHQKSSEVEVKRITHRGTVLLPARWLHDIGVNYGDQVQLTFDTWREAIVLEKVRLSRDPTLKEK